MRQGYEKHGIRKKPSFVHSQGLEFYLAPTIRTVKWGKTPMQRGGKTVVITDMIITVPNPAIDAGVLIPGFNDDYKGKAPDMGAFERGNSPMKFGRHAQGQTVLTP
ncbi:hypothetical protein ES703_35108 [subsurface metagenome]